MKNQEIQISRPLTAKRFKLESKTLFKVVGKISSCGLGRARSCPVVTKRSEKRNSIEKRLYFYESFINFG